MAREPKTARDLKDRLDRAAAELAALSAAAERDPSLRGRVDAARQALAGTQQPVRNTALLQDTRQARTLVRDVVAEELTRYWERRFGGMP